MPKIFVRIVRAKLLYDYTRVCVCAGGADRNEIFDNSMHTMLDPHLRPLEPDMSSEESVREFEEHKEVSNTRIVAAPSSSLRGW